MVALAGQNGGQYIRSNSSRRFAHKQQKDNTLSLRLTGLLRELLDVALRHPPHRRAQQEPEWPGGGQSHVLLPQIRTAAVTHPAGTVIKIPFSLLPSNISLLSQELISKSGN